MTLKQQYDESRAEAEAAGNPPPDHFRITLLDHRPIPNQVFSVFNPAQNAEMPTLSDKGIRIKPIGAGTTRINIWNRNRYWLLFPLMFPYADQPHGYGFLRNCDRFQPVVGRRTALEIITDPDQEEVMEEEEDLEARNTLPNRARDRNSDDESEEGAGGIEDEADEEPEDRPANTLRPYRPRAKGPAKFASIRDRFNYLLQRRSSIATHHWCWSMGRLSQVFLIILAWTIYANEEEHQQRLQDALVAFLPKR